MVSRTVLNSTVHAGIARIRGLCVSQITSFFSPIAQQLHLQSLLGIGTILLLAWLCSENRRAFPFRTVVAGLAMEIFLALLLLKVPVARDGLFALNSVVTALTDATKQGTSFVFGFVGQGTAPFQVTNPG